MPNYATKSHLKNVAGIDTSQFAKKVDLSNLKSEVNKLDIDKLQKEPSAKLNSLKGIVHKVDVDRLKSVSVDLKKSKVV